MVRTKTTATRRRAARPPRALTMPAAAVVRPTAQARERLERTGQQLQLAARMARRFMRTTVREVMTAARESREPMLALFRNVRLAGRHIAREAAETWHEVMPMPAMKPVMPRRAKA